MDKIALTENQFEDFQAIRGIVLGEPSESPAPDTFKGSSPPRSAIVMLLESIETGQQGRAAVLEMDRTVSRFMITVYGEATDDQVFRLRWTNIESDGSSTTEEIDEISVNSTPLEMIAKLEGFSLIEPGEVSVSFGNHARIVNGTPLEFNVWRWIVSLKNGSGASELVVPASQSSGMWVGSEFTSLKDTGSTIVVKSPLPIGHTRSGKTPQQPGAIAVVDWIDSVGWTLNAIEARWIDYDANGEVEYSHG